MQIVHTTRVGDLVHVRRRTWRVREVRAYDDCQIVTLAGIGAGAGERRVVTPFDVIEAVARPPRVRLVTPARWRRACRALLAENAPPGSLRAAAAAAIDVLPHQLEPALAIVRGSASRVLLADEVGLGKTIQAGLVAAELRARAAADRILVLTPAGLRDQWIDELNTRFALDAALVDARRLRLRRAALPVGTNPWITFPTAVASIDFVKRPEILASVRACRWDVVIVDEAHNVAGDSDRRDAIAALAARARFVLLLTATPHNGDARSFQSLCGLGGDDPVVVFRRTRAEIGLGSGRRVRILQIRPSAAEHRMHALVAEFGRAVLETAHEGEAREAVWLALAVLTKRALSSARALQFTIDRRIAALPASTIVEAHQQGLPFADQDGELQPADEAPDLTALSFTDADRERAWLDRLAAAARAAARRETKIAALTRLLRRVREPALVFTEYRDTLLHLQRALGQRAAILHGGLTRDERSAAIADFTAGRRSVLLATDAAGEGLNLHHACRLVINLELPWNPMRLEQRIGRVDRIGQRKTVHAVHLIARGTAETSILERLRKRIARARRDIGAADPLGTDDERSLARAVFGNEPDDIPSRLATAVAASMNTITLRADADAEAARLAAARRLATRSTSEPIGGDCAIWLTFARAPATRLALGRRLLCLLRAAYEDGSGRTVESTIVPAAVDWTRRRLERRDFDRFLVQLGSLAIDRLEPALSDWRRQATSVAIRFIDLQLRRERARAVAASSGLFQAGLFDRRAERDRVEQVATAADDAADAARRIRMLEEALRLEPQPPRLLLVLAP